MSEHDRPQGCSPGSNKYRLVNHARTIRTGCRGADNLFVHMAGLGNQSGLCWQTDRAMALAIGAGERSVTRWLKLLLLKGHIEKSLMKHQGRLVRVFKLMGPKAGGQNGVTAPPDRRSAASQSGGQNPIKGILSEAERAEYARLCRLPDGPERVAALAAFNRRDQDSS